MSSLDRRVRLPVVFLAALPLAVCLGCSESVGGPGPAPVELTFLGPEPAPVELTFLGPDAGCASASPMDVHIWRSSFPGKPHQVEWRVVGDGEHRWVLKRAPEKVGGDHFPPRHIQCGKDTVASGGPMNLPGKGDATWSYLVEVYDCPPDPQTRPICALDPTVIIKDGP